MEMEPYVSQKKNCHITEEVLENYAKEMLKKQESVEGLVNRAAESKLSAAYDIRISISL